MKSKNAQFTVQALAGIAIALIVTALIVGIGAKILSSVQETSAKTEKLINRTQTITATNNTFIALTDGIPNTPIDFYVYNDTARTIEIKNNIAGLGGNWTLDTINNRIQIHVSNAAAFGYTTGDSWYLRYNLTFRQTYSYNTSEVGKEGAAELADWIPTIALIIVAAILIGIVTSSFMLRRRGK